MSVYCIITDAKCALGLFCGKDSPNSVHNLVRIRQVPFHNAFSPLRRVLLRLGYRAYRGSRKRGLSTRSTSLVHHDLVRCIRHLSTFLLRLPAAAVHSPIRLTTLEVPNPCLSSPRSSVSSSAGFGEPNLIES